MIDRSPQRKPLEPNDSQAEASRSGLANISDAEGKPPLPSPVDSLALSTRQIALMGLGFGLILAIIVLLSAPGWREWALAALPETKFAAEIRRMNLKTLNRETQRLEKQVVSLRRRFESLTPRAPYLIVDTSQNRFHLMSGNKRLHEGLCSTGSYVLLKAKDQRQWIFVTPRGMFYVLNKKEAPIWRKPDWAFIEEGLPVPSPNAAERFEAGVLGEYALELGDGYLIHGTLYKRMLGMPVTHGCVRLGDEDLRIVYQNLQLGAKVFIY